MHRTESFHVLAWASEPWQVRFSIRTHEDEPARALKVLATGNAEDAIDAALAQWRVERGLGS